MPTASNENTDELIDLASEVYDWGNYPYARRLFTEILRRDSTFEEVFRYAIYKCEGVIEKVGKGEYPVDKKTIRCKHCAEVIPFMAPNSFRSFCPRCSRAYPAPSSQWDSITGVEDMYRRFRGGDRKFYLEYEMLFPEYERSEWRESIVWHE